VSRRTFRTRMTTTRPYHTMMISIHSRRLCINKYLEKWQKAVAGKSTGGGHHGGGSKNSGSHGSSSKGGASGNNHGKGGGGGVGGGKAHHAAPPKQTQAQKTSTVMRNPTSSIYWTSRGYVPPSSHRVTVARHLPEKLPKSKS
jgi:hypothetical protein